MTRPDPAHYGTDGNRYALDAREYDDEQDDEAPRRKLTRRNAQAMQEEGI